MSASGVAPTARSPPSRPRTCLHPLFLGFILSLALVPDTLQVAAVPQFLPLVARSSPFANRMQAEANIVNLTCRRLLPQLVSARRVAAIVFSDISGGAGHFLRQFCSFEAERRDCDVQTLSFGSRTAMRTSLMLRRLAPPFSSVRIDPTLRHTSVRVESCCQLSSDVDELSFPSPCFDCPLLHDSVSSSREFDPFFHSCILPAVLSLQITTSLNQMKATRLLLFSTSVVSLRFVPSSFLLPSLLPLLPNHHQLQPPVYVLSSFNGTCRPETSSENLWMLLRPQLHQSSMGRSACRLSLRVAVVAWR